MDAKKLIDALRLTETLAGELKEACPREGRNAARKTLRSTEFAAEKQGSKLELAFGMIEETTLKAKATKASKASKA